MNRTVLLLTWFGVALTFAGTVLVFAFAPGALPRADQAWFLGCCVLVVLVLLATYGGRPRDLAQPVNAAVRRVSLLASLTAGCAGAWLTFRLFEAPDSERWMVRVEHTLAVLICAGAYYLYSQRPRG